MQLQVRLGIIFFDIRQCEAAKGIGTFSGRKKCTPYFARCITHNQDFGFTSLRVPSSRTPERYHSPRATNDHWVLKRLSCFATGNRAFIEITFRSARSVGVYGANGSRTNFPARTTQACTVRFYSLGSFLRSENSRWLRPSHKTLHSRYGTTPRQVSQRWFGQYLTRRALQTKQITTIVCPPLSRPRRRRHRPRVITRERKLKIGQEARVN